jgi:Holliday junction resolvasome RuvABC endonuclease subunit
LSTAQEQVVRFGAFITKPSTKKKHIFAGDDNRRRTEEIAKLLAKLLAPDEGPIAIVCAEEFVYHRGIKASAKVGLAWGSLITRVSDRRLPLLTASPQDIKVATHGNQSATKLQVEAGLVVRYGSALRAHVKDLAASHHEHAYDAIGAIVACLGSNEIRLARQAAKGALVLGLDMGFAHIGWALVRVLP